MSAKKPELMTTARSGRVDSGTKLWLNADQVRRRAHLLVKDEKPKTKKFGEEERQLVQAAHPLVFKANEQVAIEGKPSRAVQALFVAPDPAPDAGEATAEPSDDVAELKKSLTAQKGLTTKAQNEFDALTAELTTLADELGAARKAFDAAEAENAEEIPPDVEAALDAAEKKVSGFLKAYATPENEGGDENEGDTE